ncbi:MAG: hypothetical protein RL685_1552 [Pseudomonadota bacterium]|jgi:hypothetical protein
MPPSNNVFDPTTTIPTSAALDPNGLLPTEAAYEQVLAEIQAIPEQELITVNIDVMAALTTVTGALPEIRALRSEIEENLRNFDLAQFDKLELYTLALHQAHSRYRSTATPKEDVAGLASELTVAREHLLANASSLANLKLLDGARLKNVKTVLGYRALASDVLTLCTVYRDDWTRVEGKTPYTQAELHRLGTQALQMVSVLGLREQAPGTAGEPTLLRQQAFTLFLRAYENARRAVHYLRGKAGDADSLAPSLYTSRSGRRREAEEATPAAPAAAASTTGNGPAPVGQSPSRQIVIDNAAGLPVDHPFTS